MKRLHAGIAFLALVVGLVIGSVFNNRAVAQQQGAAPVAASRYQVSAFAGGAGGSVFHGCYQVDTATGELWLIVPGQPATKISNGPQR